LQSEPPIQPLEVLFEDRSVPGQDLPPLLRELYGGELGLEEPRLYANFVATIDGVVAIPSLPRSNALIAADSKGDLFVMGLLRAFADCVLIGAGTLAASPHGAWLAERVFPAAAAEFAELRRLRGRPPKPEVAILTGHGSIDPAHPVLSAGALVVTSEHGARQLAGKLPEATTVVALGEETRLDPELLVRALRERGHGLILSEAGPHAFGALVSAGVVDELFLTTSPKLAGSADQPSILEGPALGAPIELELISLMRDGDYLFARYRLGG
jgi:riboflavin biosynthesis pyrimidine reductase